MRQYNGKKLIDQKSNQMAGVTLIETLVSVGIFVIISLALFGVYEVFGKIFNLGSAHFLAVGGARVALTEVANLTGQSYRVLNNRSLGGQNFTTNSSTLVLQLPAIDSSGKIISDIYDYAVFYASGTSFYRKLETGAGSTRINGQKFLSDALVSVNFSFDNNDYSQARRVTADIFTRAIQNRVPVESRASERIFLKNY